MIVHKRRCCPLGVGILTPICPVGLSAAAYRYEALKDCMRGKG